MPTDPSQVKIAVDKNALLYYETYVKNWEAYWLKRAPPTVLTPLEIKEEEKEISESMVNIESEVRQTKVL